MISIGDPLPYGRPHVTEDDVEAVTEVLGSQWLTTGPKVEAFEERVASEVGADHAVALSSGTAALHAMIHAVGIELGDEVVAAPMTFAATTNAVLYEGGTPIFADVDPDTLLLDPDEVAEAITERTRAILAVDYAGQPCDHDALRDLAEDHELWLLSDGCHALGAMYRGEPVGSVADLTAFSFHPVKPITTGEGGMVTLDDAELAERMRRFRDHGRTSDVGDDAPGWYHEMVDLGRNYRLSDIHCALGISQMDKLAAWTKRRRELAARYDRKLADVDGVTPLPVRPEVEHAYHLYVVRIREDRFGLGRDGVYEALRDRGIGVQVHYIPVHLHPFYRDRLGTDEGDLPETEAAYREILTLPLFPAMDDGDVDRVVDALGEVGG